MEVLAELTEQGSQEWMNAAELGRRIDVEVPYLRAALSWTHWRAMKGIGLLHLNDIVATPTLILIAGERSKDANNP